MWCFTPLVKGLYMSLIKNLFGLGDKYQAKLVKTVISEIDKQILEPLMLSIDRKIENAKNEITNAVANQVKSIENNIEDEAKAIKVAVKESVEKIKNQATKKVEKKMETGISKIKKIFK